MRIFTRVLSLFTLLVMLIPVRGISQCTSGGDYGLQTMSCNTQSSTGTINQGWYVPFSVVQNVSYNFNSTGTNYDDRLDFRQTNSSGTFLFTVDNNLACCAETIDWTATFSGTVAISNHYWSCFTWNGLSAVLNYKQNTTVNNTTSNSSICTGGTKTLSYSLGGAHSNPVPSWSIVSGGGSISGTTYSSGSYTGSVTIRATLGVCFSDVTFTVLTNSTGPTTITGTTTICNGGSTVLTQSGGSLGAGANYYWYSGSCGGASVGSGNAITVNPTSNTTYYVQAIGTCNTVPAACVNTTVTVRPTPSATISGNTTVCQGSTSPNITFSNPTALPVTVTYNINGGSSSTVSVGAGTSATVAASTSTAGTFTYNLVSVAYQSSPACSATISGSAAVTVLPTPTATISGGTTVCQNGSSPTITFTNPLSYPITVTYNVNGGTSQNVNIAASANSTVSAPTNAAGTFVYTITNAAFQSSPTCSGSVSGQTTTVTVRPTPTATVAGNATLCQNAGSPNITFTNPQSLPVNVTYNINGSGTTSVGINANSVTNISVPTGTAGTFAYNIVSVEYQTSPNCSNSVSGSATVTVRPTPTGSISGTTTVCQDASSPNITFTNSQSIPVTISYNINGGSTQTINVAASSTSNVAVSTSAAGTFTYNLLSVSYQTSPGCSNTISGSATVTVRPTPAATISGTVAVCQGATAPVITFTNPNTLAETIAYTLNGNPATINVNGNSSVTVTASTSTVGTFTYSITNVYYQSAPTCTTSVAGSAVVTVNALPVLQETHTNLSCLNSNDGIINLSVTPPGTTPPYYYSINGGSSFQGANDGTFTGLAAGTYNTLVVEDANGCRSINPLSVTLTQPPQLTISLVSSTDASCNGVFDGSITVSAGGGTPTYQYSLSGGPYQPGATFTNLAAGSYTVTVKDANDCTADLAVNLSNSYTVTATISSPINVSCPGLQDGGYTVNGSGGVTPYQYANNGLVFGSSNTFTGLPVGTYNGFVRDSRGCLASDQVTIIANPAPTAIITGNTSFCTGGSVTLSGATSTPGSGSITGFQWKRNGVNVGTGPTYSANTAGNYTVTVTNSNNCSTTSGTTTVTVNPLPTVIINPPSAAICTGASISLTASGASTYTWSPSGGLNTTTGATVSASPSNTATYTVVGTDVNGCQNSSSRQVVVNQLPTISISPSAPTICNGSSVQLTASGANSYNWSPSTGLLSTSGTTVTAQPTSNTTYTATGTDVNGCVNTANATVSVTNNPTVSITSTNFPSGVICLGQTIDLNSNFASGNQWSTGATTQTINVTPNQSGTFTYSVFSTQSGCTGTATFTVTVNPVPVAVINPSPTAAICNGSSVTLSAVTDIGTNYLWSPGSATTQNISATTANSYTVTVTNSTTGCSKTSAATTVSINSPPSVSITASPVSATICSPGTVTLTATGGMSSYSWSNGLVGQSITVSTSGTYTVTVTDANGCTNTASQLVTINPLPTVSFIGLSNNYCVSNSSGQTLTGSPSGGSFSISPSNAGLSGNVFTPSSAGLGTYTITYTYTDGNGCINTSSQSVTVNPLPTPTVTAQSATTFCYGGSVVLTTEAASSYLWSNGATTQFITINQVAQSGSYSVTSTNAFGCSATSSPVSVTVNPAPTPVISAGGPTTFCEGGNVTLSTTVPYSSYSWLPGLQSSSSIVATASGNYQVAVVDGNGCTATSAITPVTVNPNPVPTISGSLTFCTGGSTDLTASAASAYLWSPGGATTQTITVAATGTYSVTVTDANNCTGSVSATVNETPVNPVITALSNTTFCQGESVTLYSSSTSGNLWTPSNETTQFITVSTTGLVTLTVSAGSCQGTDNINITVNPLPSVSFSGLAASYCNDASAATLTGSPSGGTFSGPGITGNSFNPAAAGNGIHIITYVYTDGNGCSNTTTQQVEVTNLPTVTFSGLSSQYCENNPSVTLFGSPSGGTFSGTGISGNSFNPSVGAGVYTITYTYSDGNGCTSSSSQTVTVNAITVVSFSGLTSDYCQSQSAVSLTGSPGGGSFSGNGIIGSQFYPSVSGTGTHTITYTIINANGCSSSSSQTVTVHANPTVSFSGFNVPHAYCVDAASVALSGSPSGGTFSGTGISGNSFSPSSAGVGTHVITYSYSDGFGCSNTSTQTVTVYPLPTVTATALGSTTVCSGESVSIYSSSGTGNVWSPNGETTQFIFATATGNYSVTVTDANGCQATSAPVSVTVNPLPTPVISASGPTTFCQGDNVTLSLTSSYSQYLWSNGATTATITVSSSGNYSVTVTDVNGCTNTSAATTVTVNPLPTAGISPSGTVGICSGSNITLTGSGGVSYVWSPGGQTTQSITVASAGTYFVTVTDANGCVSVSPSTIVVVNSNPVPTVTALGPTTFCQGGSVTLVASAAVNYSWAPNGETNQIISATTTGNYVVTVTDGNGCIGTSSPALAVTVNPLPSVSYSGLAAEYCVDAAPVLVTVSPSGGFFTGPITGNTFNPSLAGIGTHVITYNYTNGNGCSNSYSQTVVVHPLPVVSFTGLGGPYCVDASAVTLTGSPSGGTFSGPGISGSQFDPAVAGAGTHTITYSYTDGNGCTNSSSQTVVVNPLPVVSFSGLSSGYCIDAAITTLTGSPAGGIFSGTGMSGDDFDPASAGVGTWTITYTYTDGNGCTNSSSQSVTVHPLPVVVFNTLANQYCITETSVTLSGTPSGGTFSGTAVSGNIFNPSVAGVGSHVLTYTYTDGNGCTNSTTATAVVVPLPVVSFSGLAAQYCVNASPAPLTGSPVGGTFSGTGVSGNNFNPAQAGVGTHTVIYTYTDIFGCTNSTSQTVVVLPLPVISFTGLGGDYCINETPATLVGNPSSGTFSGPGVSGNIFTPANAGPGNHTITFTYTNANNCTSVLTQNVIVYELPVVTITPVSQQFCVTETSVALSATPSGGTFSGIGVSGTTFNPSVAGVGTHNIIYYYTDVNGCTNSDNIDITVLSLPTVSFTGLAAQYCEDASPAILVGNPTGGTFTGSGVSGNTFDPSQAGIGSIAITYTYTDGNGCINSVTQNTTITTLPVVSISGLAAAYCVDANAVTLTGNPSGGSFSGPGMSGGTFTPSDAGVGVHIITYNYTDANNCSGSASVSVTVNDLPAVSIINSVLQYCVSESSVQLTASPSGGTFSGTGVSGDNFDPSVAGVGLHTVTYEYSDVNGCDNSTTLDFEVLDLPVVDFTGLAVQYCEDATPVTLIGNPAGGIFAGNGISGDTFDPSQAQIGPNPVTYTYSDGNGCENRATHITEVYSLPIVSFTTLYPDYCIDASNIQLDAIPAGGGFLGNGIVNGNEFSPSSAGVGTHTITYAYINTVGCLGTSQQTTEVHPLPVVTFTGLGSTYCLEADSVPLTGSPVGGYFTGPALNDSVFYPFYAGAGTHTITYNYYDVNGCFNSYSQTVTVYQLAQPTVSANGPTTFCEGDDVTLAAQSSFISYLWSNGSTTTSISVDVESDNFVMVTDANGCVAYSDTIHITVNPLPVVDLGGDVSVCQGGSVTLDAGSGFATYLWNPGGATTQSITASVAGDYRVNVTDVNGCFNFDEITLSLYQPQVPVITANGSPSICQGSTLVLDAGSGFQSYAWSNNNANTQTNTVDQSGNYTVTTVDANGCTATSTAYNVTVIPLPVVTIQANGPTNICQGNTVTLSMPAGYASYLWSNNATTNSITVNTAGDYFGSATNSSGCSNFTSTINVTVNPQPQPVIIPQGPITLCFGESILLDAGNQGYTTYNWFRNLTPMNVHSQFAPVGTSGSYTVSVIDTNGCGQGVTSPPVVVTVQPQLVPVITISPNQDTLYSSPAQTYQWYFNGVPVAGANQQFYVPQASGNYRVVVTDNNGCEGTSTAIEYSYIGIETVESIFTSFNLFPNPGKGRFTLVAEFRTPSDATIMISDVLGKQMLQVIDLNDVSSLKQEVSLEQFANGVYFVRVLTNDGQKVIRYIKE